MLIPQNRRKIFVSSPGRDEGGQEPTKNRHGAEKMIFTSDQRMALPSKRALSGHESTEEPRKKTRFNEGIITNDRPGQNKHFPHEGRKIPHEGLGQNLPYEEVKIPHEELRGKKRGLIPSEDELSRRFSTKGAPKWTSVLSEEIPNEEFKGHRNFILRASLGLFVAGSLPGPFPEASYNDDINIPHYKACSRAYAGVQRKGIRDDHPDATTIIEHVRAALEAPFFLAQEIELPPALNRAVCFMATTPTNTIKEFWYKQVHDLKNIKKCTMPVLERWRQLTPDTLKGVSIVDPAMLSFLFRKFGLGGSKWLKQLIFGFPITGVLSQEGAYPLDSRVKLTTLDKETVLESTFDRFRQRATNALPQHAETLWAEACEQSDKGWLSRPFPVNASGSKLSFKGKGLNFAFRFAVIQGEKIRACDDLRHSLTNQACAVLTPIKLVSWDHVSHISNKFAEKGLECHFFKADHRAAYKSLPVCPNQTKLAVVVLKNPHDGLWYAFTSKTLLFGSIASVLHYNILSRAIAELMSLIFGIPVVCFFDDFGAVILKHIAKEGLWCFEQFCEICGIDLKGEKTEIGQKVSFLGLLGNYPHRKTISN